LLIALAGLAWLGSVILGRWEKRGSPSKAAEMP